MSSNTRKIRPIALCIFRRDDHILVFEAHYHTKNQTFCRLLGGGIEFGELSRDAIIREIREELSAEIHHLEYLCALENIFVYQGESKHEIVQLYKADFVDPAMYAQEKPPAFEVDGSPINAMWKPLTAFRSGALPLYPNGVLDIVTRGE